MRNQRFLFITGLIVIAAITRLLPHPPNFAPIAAIALFGGTYFTKKYWAFIIPAAAMLASDLFLGFHSSMLYVYGAFALIVGIGFWIRGKVNFSRFGAGVLGASLLFFIVTNFGVWLGSGMYAHTFSGLISCYVAAIPFFHYSLLGNVIYAGALYGVFEAAKRYYPQLAATEA